MTENWKDIPGYEDYYQASNFGMIRSKNRIVPKGKKRVPTRVRGQIMAPWIDENGYLKVDLFINGQKRSKRVHTLIAKTFIPNPLNKETVNHIDENTLNNTVRNLEWMTNEENLNYGTRIQRIKEKYGKRVVRLAPNGDVDVFQNMHEAEEITGIKRQSIRYAIDKGTKLKGFAWFGSDRDCMNYEITKSKS